MSTVNLSNPDRLGPQKAKGVLISGVEQYTNVVFGTSKTVLYIEVSLFRSVLIEGLGTVYLSLSTLFLVSDAGMHSKETRPSVHRGKNYVLEVHGQ